MKKPARIAASTIIVCLLVGALGACWFLRRNPVLHDPTTIKYAMWREGLNPDFPKRQINGYLNEDIDRDSLVRGLTLEQVKAKFYDVRTQDNWTAYQRYCILHYPQPEEEIAFLGDDWWGVRFRQGHATGFILIKGC